MKTPPSSEKVVVSITITPENLLKLAGKITEKGYMVAPLDDAGGATNAMSRVVKKIETSGGFLICSAGYPMISFRWLIPWIIHRMVVLAEVTTAPAEGKFVAYVYDNSILQALNSLKSGFPIKLQDEPQEPAEYERVFGRWEPLPA